MKSLAGKVMKKFAVFQHINWAVGWQIQIVNRWLIQPIYKSFHQFICERMMFTLKTSHAMPWFCDYLSWIPTALRSGVSCKELMGRLDLLSQVRSPPIFNLTVAVLKEQLTLDPRRRDTLDIDSCLTFLTDHARNQSYYSIVYLRKLVALLAELHRDVTFHFCMNALKTLRFLPVFLAICDIIKRVGDPEYSGFLVTTMAQMTPSEGHRRALEMIGDGTLSREALAVAAMEE
jgi:hypothetical protein